MPGQGEWFLSVNGARVGPLTRDQLVAQLWKQERPHDVMVWSSGMPHWVAAGKVTEFAAELPPVPRGAPIAPPPAASQPVAPPSPPLAPRPTIQPTAASVQSPVPATVGGSSNGWIIALVLSSLVAFGSCSLAANPGQYAASTGGLLDTNYTEVTRRQRSGGTTSKSYDVTYRFSVAGRTYTGSDKVYQEPQVRACRVWYDPANPHDNGLRARKDAGAYVMVTLVAFGAAVISLRGWIRSRRSS